MRLAVLCICIAFLLLSGCDGKPEDGRRAALYEFSLENFYNMMKPFTNEEHYHDDDDDEYLYLDEGDDRRAGYYGSRSFFRFNDTQDRMSGRGGRRRINRRFPGMRRPFGRRNMVLPGYRPLYVPYPMPFYY